MARPTKLTPEVQQAIVNAIALGNYREVAAGIVGVYPDTLGKWMHRRGEPYEGFRRAVLEAEHLAEIRMAALVARAAASDPDHAKWWLERKFPQRWGRREAVAVRVSGEVQTKGVVLVVGGTSEQYLEALRRARNGGAPALPEGEKS